MDLSLDGKWGVTRANLKEENENMLIIFEIGVKNIRRKRSIMRINDEVNLCWIDNEINDAHILIISTKSAFPTDLHLLIIKNDESLEAEIHFEHLPTFALPNNKLDGVGKEIEFEILPSAMHSNGLLLAYRYNNNLYVHEILFNGQFIGMVCKSFKLEIQSDFYYNLSPVEEIFNEIGSRLFNIYILLP